MGEKVMYGGEDQVGEELRVMKKRGGGGKEWRGKVKVAHDKLGYVWLGNDKSGMER